MRLSICGRHCAVEEEPGTRPYAEQFPRSSLLSFLERDDRPVMYAILLAVSRRET